MIPSGIDKLDAALGGGYGQGLHVVCGNRGSGVTGFLCRLARVASNLHAHVPFVAMSVTVGRLRPEFLPGTNVGFYIDQSPSMFVGPPHSKVLFLDNVFHLCRAHQLDIEFLQDLQVYTQKHDLTVFAGFSRGHPVLNPSDMNANTVGPWILNVPGRTERGAGLLTVPAALANSQTYIFDPKRYPNLLDSGGDAVATQDACNCGSFKVFRAQRGSALHNPDCPWRK